MLPGLMRNWAKPLYSLFLYNMIDREKLTFLVTKGLSLLFVLSYIQFFANGFDDRIAGIFLLGMVTAHAYLIFRSHHFTEIKTSFLRNLPISKSRLVMQFALLYLTILLPEALWLLLTFESFTALLLLIFGLTLAVLFRCLLFYLGLNMKRYLHTALAIFVVYFIVILYDQVRTLVVINVLLSCVLFYRSYYGRSGMVSATQ
jgi:hypothetical protein